MAGLHSWELKAVIQDDAETLALFREAMVEGPGQPKTTEAKSINDNVINTLSSQGNSKAYTVSRLKRDRPDLFEKVVAGELSANKAAIEAGFRRKPEGNQNNKAEKSNVTKVTIETPSQTSYASEMGVSRKTVNDWESDAKILD